MSFQHLGKSSETLPKLNRDPTNHDMHFIVEVIDYLWGRCLGWLYTVTLQIDETSLHCSGDENCHLVNGVLFQNIRILSFQHISTKFRSALGPTANNLKQWHCSAFPELGNHNFVHDSFMFFPECISHSIHVMVYSPTFR